MRTERRQSSYPSPGDTAESEGTRLVARWQKAAGEKEREDIFRVIFERYHGLVLRFFFRRGAPLNQSQDLAQETFLRAYRYLGDFRTEARFETWLFQIASNIYRNMVRDQSARKRDGREASLDSMDTSTQSALQSSTREEEKLLPHLLDEERSRLLHAAIQNLPPQMRRCLQLRLGLGLKYRDIADVMQISVDTVKAHLFQAKQKLRDELGNYFSGIEF